MARTHMTRRSMLGSVGASLAPALGMPQQSSAGLRIDDLLEGPQPRSRPAFAGSLMVGQIQQGPGKAPGQWTQIVGGEVAGPEWGGTVQGGRIDWQLDAGRNTVEFTARFGVLRQDGTVLQVIERGSAPAAADRATLCTAVEVSAGALALPSVMVGRMDVSGLDTGIVRLLAFEVS
jgi:hypothetical protein